MDLIVTTMAELIDAFIAADRPAPLGASRFRGRGMTLRIVTVALPAPHASLDASVAGSMLDATREYPTPIVEVPILALAGRRAITCLERQRGDIRRQ